MKKVIVVLCGVMAAAGAVQAVPVQPPTPLAYYSFDGHSDDEGGAHHGTNNGATFDTDTPFSYGGNRALDFDGAGDHVLVADAPVLRPGLGAWTLSAWFKALANDQFGGLIAKRQDGSPHNQMDLNVGGNMQIGGPGRNVGTLVVEDGGTDNYQARTNAVVLDGTWHHAAVVKFSTVSSPAIYLDGALVTDLTVDREEGTPPRNVDNTWDWVIGSLNVGLLPYDGLIDEPAMWNTALTAGHMEWLSQNSLFGSTPVPEPAGLGLIGLALLAAGRKRRR